MLKKSDFRRSQAGDDDGGRGPQAIASFGIGTKAMIAKLYDLGFSQAIHFSPEDANERHCHGRRDGLWMPSWLRLVRAVV